MRTFRTCKISYKNIEIKISIVLYTIKYFLDRSSILFFSETIISDLLLVFSVIPLLVFIGRRLSTKVSVNQRKYVNSIYGVLAVIVIAVVLYRIIPYVIYIYTLLLLVASKYIEGTKIMHIIKRCMIIMLIALAFLSLIGIIPNISTEAGRYNLGLENRMFGWYLLNYCLIELYERNRYSNKKYALLFAMNIAVYYFTRTRLSFILFIILLLICLCEDKGIKINKKMQKALSGLFVILFLGTLYFTVYNAKYTILEALFSGRFRFGLRVLKAYGISLLPRNIIYYTQEFETGSYTMYVDSGYIDLLVRFGVLITIIVLLFYTYLIRKSIKTSNYRWFVWLMIIALFNVVNNSFFNIFFDCSALLLWHEQMLPESKKDKYVLQQTI